jgi:4-amino-4-deoxy-L-arabinose transferase-like glycosyltransferase
VFFLGLFAITLSGFPQYTDNEWRLSAYVLDVLENGRWFCPTDANGDVISKPPMLVWLGVLGAAFTGRVNGFAMYWPTAAAAMATAMLLFVYGRKFFGWRAGLLSAMAYALSYIALSQMSMARYDGLLSLPVTAAALAAFSAWQTGKGWTWFWLFSALGTLVKGPIALVLPAFGLASCFWERKSHPAELPRLRGSHLPGILLYLLLTVGWFALAYVQTGQPLIDKMLGRELVRHAVQDGGGPLSGIAGPGKSFLGIYAPWSLIAIACFWRILRRPAADPRHRQLERFLFVFFFLGIVMFSVAAHQRGRLIYPLVPAAALLVGGQLSRWTSRVPQAALLRGCSALAVIFLGACFIYTHVLLGRSTRAGETLAMKQLAQHLTSANAQLPLIYVAAPLSLKVWMNSRQPDASPQQAAAWLAGAAPAYVVTRNPGMVRSTTSNTRLFEVFSWSSGRSTIVILSNRQSLPPERGGP